MLSDTGDGIANAIRILMTAARPPHRQVIAALICTIIAQLDHDENTTPALTTLRPGEPTAVVAGRLTRRGRSSHQQRRYV